MLVREKINTSLFVLIPHHNSYSPGLSMYSLWWKLALTHNIKLSNQYRGACWPSSLTHNIVEFPPQHCPPVLYQLAAFQKTEKAARFNHLSQFFSKKLQNQILCILVKQAIFTDMTGLHQKNKTNEFGGWLAIFSWEICSYSYRLALMKWGGLTTGNLISPVFHQTRREPYDNAWLVSERGSHSFCPEWRVFLEIHTHWFSAQPVPCESFDSLDI